MYITFEDCLGILGFSERALNDKVVSLANYKSKKRTAEQQRYWGHVDNRVRYYYELLEGLISILEAKDWQIVTVPEGQTEKNIMYSAPKEDTITICIPEKLNRVRLEYLGIDPDTRKIIEPCSY